MDKKILVVGSLNMDVSIGTDKLPAVGETVLGNVYTNSPGGKGANQAYAAGMFGGSVGMLGCVGSDEYGSTMLSALAGSGVDVSGIGRIDEAKTGTAFVAVDKHGSNSIIVIPGANGECSVDYLRAHRDGFERASYLLVQMEIPAESVFYAVKTAREEACSVILNPAPAAPIPDCILEKVDVLTPNETELAILAGRTLETDADMEKAAMELIGRGVGKVVVTLGERGALLVDEKGCRLICTDKAEAVDTTGAGDCFNGVLAVLLSEGRDIEEAVKIAARAASISVTRFGAMPSMPQRKELLI